MVTEAVAGTIRVPGPVPGPPSRELTHALRDQLLELVRSELGVTSSTQRENGAG